MFLQLWPFTKFKGNAQFVQNTTFGLWEKTIAQFRKMFRKIPMNTHATISVMLVCQFAYAEALLDFKGWLEKTLHKKALVMDSLYAWNFIKKWLQHICFPVNFANFQEQLLRKTYANRCFFIILFIYLFFFFFDSVNTFDVLRF